MSTDEILAPLTDRAAADPVSIYELLVRTAGETDPAPAVLFEDGAITYAELWRQANAVARALTDSGVGRGALVGVNLPRGPAALAAVLAIAKVGCVYLPLDPEYPRERIDFIVDDACPELVLTEGRLRDGRRLGMDEVLVAGAGPAEPVPVAPDDPAYVLYTSGSTGQPRGVVVPHRAIANRIAWEQGAFPLTRDDRVLHRTALSFDISLWEILLPLSSGAALVVAARGTEADPRHLVRLIRQHAVTTIGIVPPLLAELLDASPSLAECESVRRVFVGGEVLPVPLHDRFLRAMSAELVNMYGPTEYAIDATYWECKPGAYPEGIPIGRPIANTTVRLTDAEGWDVPPGEHGEIRLTGAGTALGYLGRPALTAEKFVPGGSGAVEYRTGDMGRRRPDGSLAFVGRRDDQVKVNGYRVELGEVESALGNVPGVRRGCVALRRIAEVDTLVAFVEIYGNTHEHSIRQALAETLPRHMVPNRVVILERLPTGPSGKVARAELPELAAPAETPTSAAAEPDTDDVTARVASVFADVLGVEHVDPQDDFFSLGGNSLQALRLARRLGSALGREVDLDLLFEAPSPAGIAEAMAEPSG